VTLFSIQCVFVTFRAAPNVLRRKGPLCRRFGRGGPISWLVLALISALVNGDGISVEGVPSKGGSTKLLEHVMLTEGRGFSYGDLEGDGL